MTETTPLDTAHAAMQADPGDGVARLRFYERLADAELFLLLTEEPAGETLSPETFEVADGTFVLAFDREDRLAGFTGRPVPYAALSGRALAGMLRGQGIGLGLNLDVAPSSILIPAEAMTWLAGTLDHVPTPVETGIAELRPPAGLPEALLRGLDAKLTIATGLADCAWLAGVRHADGTVGHLLAFVGARPGAEPALAKAAGEAVTFSGIEDGALDVGFFAASDPVVARLAATGLRIDLPQPPAPAAARAAPGSDPASPPILRSRNR